MIGLPFDLGFDRWLAEGFFENLLPVVNFLIIITIYAVLIWHFHRFVATRDFFRFNSERFRFEGFIGKVRDVVVYLLEYAVIYPIFVFVFFIVFAFLLLVLSSSLSVDSVLVTSIALVSAIRISSYYNEDLAKEVAKLFPLVVLSVFLVNPSFVSWPDLVGKVALLPSFVRLALQFVLFVVLLEWSLRFLRSFVGFFRALLSYKPPIFEDLPSRKPLFEPASSVLKKK